VGVETARGQGACDETRRKTVQTSAQPAFSNILGTTQTHARTHKHKHACTHRTHACTHARANARPFIRPYQRERDPHFTCTPPKLTFVMPQFSRSGPGATLPLLASTTHRVDASRCVCVCVCLGACLCLRVGGGACVCVRVWRMREKRKADGFFLGCHFVC
jgi:hypothetical protein